MIEIIGLMHPALVHMPIGIILVAMAYEWYFQRESAALWFAATVSSLVAVASGLLHIQSGHFEGLEVFLHLVTGIATAVVSSLLFISKWNELFYFKWQNALLKWVLFGLLLYGGHKGAEITHGKNYIPFLAPAESEKVNYSTRDSIIVYSDIIAPIFKEKCLRCHETIDARGKLNMETHEGLLSDTYGDPAVFPGNLDDSEIYKRISLEPSDKKYMPPSGEDLSYVEKRLIEWWIVSGASFTDEVREMTPPADIKTLLLSNYGIDLREKTFYEKASVASLDQSIITDIRSNGYNVNLLAANTNFIDINMKGHTRQMTSERIQSLLQAKDQITWLDLSNSDFGDDHSPILSELSNVTKLKLQNTSITDKTIERITDQEHLTVLNLYNTNVTDQSIDNLLKMNQLKKLFIWQSGISSKGVKRLQESNSDLEIVGATTAFK